MPENPSNDYNQDILKALEELMAQDPLEDNIFIKLIQDNQPKSLENHEPKLNLVAWIKLTMFNPRITYALYPLYNNSKEIITPAFQAALLQSPVTKDFITRIAGNKKIRDSFAKEIDCLFQKDGVLDNNGAESLGKALSVGNSAEAIQNIITQYIYQTKDKPIDGVELYAKILGEVKKNNSLKQCVQDRKLGITEIVQSYLVTRKGKEDYIQKSWEAMRDATEDSKIKFLIKYVDDLQDDQEIDAYIKEHRTLPLFEKDKLGSYGLDVESLNILLDDFGPVLLQQLDETADLLHAINTGESIKEALFSFKLDDFKFPIQNNSPAVVNIFQSYLTSRKGEEEVLQGSWEAMRDAPKNSKIKFLKESVGIQDDQEIDVYIKEHRTLPSFEKDKLGSYGLDVESTNKLLGDFGPILLQNLDETSDLLRAINAGESTKDVLFRFKLDDFKLPIQNNAPTVAKIFQSYLTSRKGEEEVLQGSWEAMQDDRVDSKIKFLKESVGIQEDQEIKAYIKEHRTLPSFEKDKLGSYGLDVESTNKLLGDFGPVLLQNIDEISGIFNAIEKNKISDAVTMFFKLLDKNPKLLQSMKDNSHITNKIVDSTLGNSASSRFLKAFLANPNQMNAKSFIENVVLPTVKASSQVYDYTTKIKNMIIYMVDLVVRSFKPLFNSKKTAPERAPTTEQEPTTAKDPNDPKRLASVSPRSQAKGLSPSQRSSARKTLESSRAKEGDQTKGHSI